MFTTKIFTFGDGYATGHIWPEWPQILAALLPNYTVINTSAVGAGPEWLVNQLVNLLPTMENSKVIFQWPIAARLDKLIEDDHWQQVADTDSVYSFNQHNSWWLSSASTQPDVIKYHQNFIQQKQHQSRKSTYEILVKHTLASLNCDYISISTIHQQDFSAKNEFILTRQHEVQPSPIVHFAYITDMLLPQLAIEVDTSILNELKHRIKQHKWVAYDPDRAEIWQNPRSKSLF